ncbi:MAG: M20/M25/M40 family metallo-hydrolase [Crocinitomicaceae bacterium]
MQLLKQLTGIRSASGDEGNMKQFLLNYINENQNSWKVKPSIYEGGYFQDNLILVFGNQPKTAIYAHTDSIGFTVGYDRELIKVGGPKLIDGIELVGSDSQGEIEAELVVIEELDNFKRIEYVCERPIERGTYLTFKPNFVETENYVESPYMDNRLGVWNALKVAESLENGAIVFSTYEEHGGNSVGFISRFLFEKYGIYQALISDITWVTDGVQHEKGVAISMRDSGIPRRSFLNRIIELAKESGVKFQLEVESAGGSDGGMMQKSSVPIDWCFIGAAEDNVHSPNERVAKIDIVHMVELYNYLMKNL